MFGLAGSIVPTLGGQSPKGSPGGHNVNGAGGVTGAGGLFGFVGVVGRPLGGIGIPPGGVLGT